jgi:hypothetical protein
MISVPLAPRTGRVAFLALLALALWPALAVATPTTNGGAAYAQECVAAGVPSPPDWGTSQWVWKGDQDPTKLLLPNGRTIVKVYLYKSYKPQGICVAISRRRPEEQTLARMEIICQGHTGKACFWDNIHGGVPFTGVTQIVGGTLFGGGADLENGPAGRCSSCHAGDNAFIVHPGTAVDLKDSKGVSILNSGIWMDPLVLGSWPQSRPPVTGLNQCTSCHRRPTHTDPYGAGRLPEVSTATAEYCDPLLRRTQELGFMPPAPLDPNAFLADFAHLRMVKCASPPSGTLPPLLENPEAFKGRFVFGDQDMNIYAANAYGDLVFYKHTGAENGTNNWYINGNVVAAKENVAGTDWASFKKLFTGGRGVIYGLTGDNKLLWYKHLGQVNGTPDWHAASGSVVGTGWGFDQIFATTNEDGVIYGVGPTGQLHWYKHTGRSDGASTWAAGSGNVVGYGWNSLSRLMAGPSGVIYGVNSDKNLVWTRHTGFTNGTFSWAPNTGAVVGWGWLATTMFTGYQGRIYTLGGDRNLYWYRHIGYLDGTVNWAHNNGLQVASDWGFMPQPYFD